MSSYLLLPSMKSGYGLTVDGLFEPVPADLGLVSRHVPSLSDELGDRVLILDERGSPSLELLRFRKTLTAFPGFEVALRRRTERLRQFQHPTFSTTPAVEYLGEDRGLVLLTSYAPGRRLSEVLADAQGPAFASSLIHQLTPALAILHQYADGIGHGALTASRVVISPDGQLIIIEHVLAPALERLQLTPARMHLELGVPQPMTEAAARRGIESRTDFFQLGLIALSLLLGRRLSSDEYPGNLNGALDQALHTPDREAAAHRGLRDWLERALQLNGRAFPSSADALDSLRDVPDQVAEHTARRWRELLRTPDAQADGRVETHQPSNSPETPPAAPAPSPTAAIEAAIEAATEAAIEDAKEETMDQPRALWIASQTDVRRNPPSSGGPRGSLLRIKPNDYLRLAVAAFAFCAIAEAVVIAMLLQRRLDAPAPAPVKVAEVNLETADPGASVTVDGRSVGVTPLQLAIGPDVRSISIVGPPQPAAKQEEIVGSTGQQNPVAQNPAARADARSASAVSSGPAAQRSGGIRLSSPIDLEVFEGDTRLGSSATGIVSAPAGRRELDLVNSVLGFRLRQVVDIKAGQVVPLAVTPPNGIININAVPWAEVLIDGKVVGETPIGNLSLPLGNHEITFRHPQFAELRQSALVRSDTVTRISVNLQR
jgi:PEGA domain